MRKSIWLLLAVFVLLAVVLMATGYYTDYLWYESIGAVQVFIKPFVFELVVKSVLWAIGLIFLFANLLPFARIKKQRLQVVNQTGAQAKPALSRRLIAAVSAGLSLFWVWLLPSLWDRVMLMLNASPTGQVDPVLGRDISWYLFSYPVYTILSGTALGLLVLAAVAVGAGYFYSGALKVKGRLAIAPNARRHFSILMTLFLLWFAFSRQLNMARLLVSQSTSLFGAGYTDVHVRLPLQRVLQLAALGMAVVSLMNWKLQRTRLLLAAPVLLILVSIIGGIYGLIVQQFVVGPNQLVRETPYIRHHIEATRQAFGLDALAQIEFKIDEAGLSADVLQDRQKTIDNIRLLDYRPLQQQYHQSQSLRLYYEFNNIDIDRYIFGDEYYQVMLALRELNVDSLPAQAQTPINRHFKYTHGYGVVMSPVNKITANGHPTFFLRDIPVQSTVDIPLERPEIYFGELTNQFVVVNTADGEFGYFGQDQERAVQYQGSAGVELSPFRRLLYALRFRSSILLLSDEITANSRIMYNRNIVDRIKRVAPFLRLDGEPYPVVAQGQVYWLVDAYTTSSLYPYSQPAQGLNYLRNSVKVVVDAYQGTVDLYKFDDNDPIITAWEGVFPGLIKDSSDFPEALATHVRYPLDYFQIQANVLRTYHMTDPTDFYNREDAWEIAVENYRGEEILVEPYFVSMQLPGREETEYVLMLPYTPLNRNNMIGWLAAGNDGENLGRLELFHFPRGELVEGPSQVEAYIDQDPLISQQITLWDQGGSEVVRGNLLTIPLDGSILYVEPLYIVAQNRSVPELRQVIVFYNDVLVMERSLDLALERLFGVIEEGEPNVPEDGGISRTLQELIQQLISVNTEIEQAAREGRWADYGRLLDELDQLLTQLESQFGQPPDNAE